jgi:hypothetical protein
MCARAALETAVRGATAASALRPPRSLRARTAPPLCVRPARSSPCRACPGGTLPLWTLPSAGGSSRCCAHRGTSVHKVLWSPAPVAGTGRRRAWPQPGAAASAARDTSARPTPHRRPSTSVAVWMCTARLVCLNRCSRPLGRTQWARRHSPCTALRCVLAGATAPGGRLVPVRLGGLAARTGLPAPTAVGYVHCRASAHVG